LAAIPTHQARPLPGLPRKALSPQEQMEALRQLQVQAEHRIKLGRQLFQAAESTTVQHRKDLEQLKAQQDDLREQLQQDMTKSFRQYDHWMGQVDDRLTRRMDEIDTRLQKLTSDWEEGQTRVEEMLLRAEKMLDQTRHVLETEMAKLMGPRERVAGEGSPESGDASAISPADTPAPQGPAIMYTELIRKLSDSQYDA
jgi:hypothetical protein